MRIVKGENQEVKSNLIQQAWFYKYQDEMMNRFTAQAHTKEHQNTVTYRIPTGARWAN